MGIRWTPREYSAQVCRTAVGRGRHNPGRRAESMKRCRDAALRARPSCWWSLATAAPWAQRPNAWLAAGVRRSPAPSSGAMYEFLLARRAEAQDDAAAAEAALDRAVALDPSSAELRAELAGFLARQNRAADAVAAAERAVSLDADSEEGHRILGLVHAAWADGAVDGPTGGTTGGLACHGHRPPDADPDVAGDGDRPRPADDARAPAAGGRRRREGGAAAGACRRRRRRAVEPLALLAEAHRSLGQFDRAATALEQAAESNPRLLPRARRRLRAPGQMGRSRGRVREGRGERAWRRPRTAIAARLGAAQHRRWRRGGAGDHAAHRVREDQPARRHRPDAAGACLSAAGARARTPSGPPRRRWRSSPNNLQVLGLLSSVYRERYDFAAIVALARRRPRPDDAVPTGVRVGEFVRLLAELGGAQQQQGDYAAAVRTFERARSLLPDARRWRLRWRRLICRPASSTRPNASPATHG